MGGRKTKKQKRELSHAEIWDDSALVQSWDDALAEYKMYHSIQAQGEKVQDAMKKFDERSQAAGKLDHFDQATNNGAPEDGPKGTDPELLEDGEVEEGEMEEPSDRPLNESSQNASHREVHQHTSRSQHSSILSAPSIMANGIQDDALKNLMMSWYYAGYYTGLYEGQNSPKSPSTG